jgi:two-component system, OmpR family, alkaline phosphatase synthesis response regulator PhoP
MPIVSKYVLMCDDEPMIIRAAEIKLVRAGFEVRVCADGQAAWESIQQRRPDLLISDCQMPRLGGLELLKRLREHEATRDLPTFMLTGKGFELPVDELREKYGLLGVISKPFSPRELLKTVEAALAVSSV